MVLRFQRVRSFLGSASTMKVYINGELAFERGLICGNCKGEAQANPSLIFPIEMGIIDILNYMFNNSLRSLENLALKEEVQKKAEKIMKAYIAYHLGIEGLKSESLMI